MDYRQFNWDILGDCADEDAQMLYEPLAYARACWPEMADSERQALVEKALRELRADGLLGFIHAPKPNEMDDPAQQYVDPSEALTDSEVDEVLASDEWRSIPVGRLGANVWLAATPEGAAAVKDAPHEVKQHWLDEASRWQNERTSE